MREYVVLASILFAIGAFGVISRRNILVVLMSLELMFNAGNLLLISFARARADASPHVLVLIVMAVAAAEVAVGLAILLALFRQKQSVDTEDYASMKG